MYESSLYFFNVPLFLIFSGMDCKSSNNVNKKLIQGKFNILSFLFYLKDYVFKTALS